MTAFPVVDVALEGFRLTRERPRTVLAWGLVLAAAQALTTGLLAASGAGAGLVALMHAGPAQGADPLAAKALLSGAAPGLLLSSGVGLFADTLVYTALLRAVLRPAERRGAFLRLGSDELRLMVVVLGLAALALGASVVLTGALATLTLPLAAASGFAVSGAAPLVVALTVAILSYPVVRLSLAPAATVAEGRAALFGGWAATREVFWPLMGGLVMAAALAAVVFVTAEVLVTCLWALGSGADMDGAARSLQPGVASLDAAVSPGSVASVVVGGVVSAFALTVAAAPAAAAYRLLAGRRG